MMLDSSKAVLVHIIFIRQLSDTSGFSWKYFWHPVGRFLIGYKLIQQGVRVGN